MSGWRPSDGAAVAPYRLNLRGPSGALGSLVVSTTTPSDYLADVRHLTGRDAALLGAGRPDRRDADPGRREPAGERPFRRRRGRRQTASRRHHRPARSRRPAARPVRPHRVGGLLLLEPAWSPRCWPSSRSPWSSWPCCCGRSAARWRRCSTPRGASARATSATRCRSSARTRWPGWRASSTR